MASPLATIIGVADPTTYHCKVWGYVPSHSQLLIRVYKEPFLTGERFYLLFESVLYFEGTMYWTGVNFRFGTQAECIALIQQEDIQIPEEALAGFLLQHHLYVIDQPERKVRIFAGSVHKGMYVPSIFAGSPKE